MVRAGRVQQYSYANLNASEMDYYASVKDIAGKIIDNDLPDLRAWIHGFQQGYELMKEAIPTLKFLDGSTLLPDDVREIISRCCARYWMGAITTDNHGFQEIDKANLDELLFKHLYPVNVLSEQSLQVVQRLMERIIAESD